MGKIAKRLRRLSLYFVNSQLICLYLLFIDTDDNWELSLRSWIRLGKIVWLEKNLREDGKASS